MVVRCWIRSVASLVTPPPISCALHYLFLDGDGGRMLAFVCWLFGFYISDLCLVASPITRRTTYSWTLTVVECWLWSSDSLVSTSVTYAWKPPPPCYSLHYLLLHGDSCRVLALVCWLFGFYISDICLIASSITRPTTYSWALKIVECGLWSADSLVSISVTYAC